MRDKGRLDDLVEAYDEKDDPKMKDLIKNFLPHSVDNEV